MAGIGFGTNYDAKVGNGLGPRTLIVTLEKSGGNHTQADLNTVVQALASAGGSGTGTDSNGPDAFTVAGIAGTVGTDALYLALQGTGTLDESAGAYATNVTLTVVATFNQA